jgi:hypothetical protein
VLVAQNIVLILVKYIGELSSQIFICYTSYLKYANGQGPPCDVDTPQKPQWEYNTTLYCKPGSSVTACTKTPDATTLACPGSQQLPTQHNMKGDNGVRGKGNPNNSAKKRG